MGRTDAKKTETITPRTEPAPRLVDLEALEPQSIRGGLPSTFTSSGTVTIDVG